MTEPRIIRPSSLVTFLDCPRRWAARHMADTVAAAGYALAPARPVHVGAAVGSGVHAAAGYTLSEKLASGSLGSDSEAEDRAVSEFAERTEHGVGFDATTADVSTAKKQLARMSRSYRRHLAPAIRPLLIEERLEADVGGGWAVSGQVDTLAGDPDQVVGDLKTGVMQRANGVQYATYAMVFRAHGYRVAGIVEWFVPRVRISNEQPHPTTTAIDLAAAQADALEAIDAVKRAADRFATYAADPSGRPAPSAFRANPASSLCSSKWCPAWGTDFCRAHKLR